MKKIALVSAVLVVVCLIGAGSALMTNYGSMTGYATVEQALKLDIMGSSNDENYTLSAYQGETEHSPRIKLDNKADVPIPVNITTSILSGGTNNDVTLTIVDETKNITLSNPIMVPTTDISIYIAHEFATDANVGTYMFSVNAVPA